jgi:hypothetical protein
MPQKKERRFQEEQERAARAADLEALRVFRDYLIFKAETQGDAHERLRIAIDDYAGEITGDRKALRLQAWGAECLGMQSSLWGPAAKRASPWPNSLALV